MPKTPITPTNIPSTPNRNQKWKIPGLCVSWDYYMCNNVECFYILLSESMVFATFFDIFQYYWPLGSWSLGTIVKEKSRNVPCASDEGESALFYPLWCPFSFLQYRWAVHFGLVNFAFLIFLLRKSFFTFLTLFFILFPYKRRCHPLKCSFYKY